TLKLSHNHVYFFYIVSISTIKHYYLTLHDALPIYFLAKKTSKSKRKFNIDPFVLIEHLLSDHEDDEQEVEDDDVASIEDDDLEQNVNFDASESGYGDDDSDTPNINIDQGFAWIVYWILKYQERYRLSDVATNSLIKFIRYLLISHGKNTYSTFSTSLYMTRKLFD